MLEQINLPKDLKDKTIKQKEELAEDIRKLIIETVSKNGGHLASNLGVVELTIALHSVFDAPKDKIIWDVGHQAYVHKILTGRKDKFSTLRKKNGLAGFPKITESEYDCFNTGHSSTSISAALGMAKARDLLKEDYKVIAVIGDGALTGGMALEALNDAGYSKTDLIVVLNDNEMSISKNIGGMATFLAKLRTRRSYTKMNQVIKNGLGKIPYAGEHVIRGVQKVKSGLKHLFIPKMFFEDIGYKYLGPVDGHDIDKLMDLFKIAKTTEGPVLIHVVTKKGKGYKPAEEEPDKFHSTGSFDIETGKKNSSGKDYSSVFGEKLVELAKNDSKIVAVTASMKEGTGLLKFEKEFPERFFDVGIAEQHAIGFTAGLAKAGLKPVIPIYSSFLQRGYDQVIHDICIQNLPVTICVDRAGVVGNDGETHQGIFDLSFLNTVPNLTVMAPKNFKELESMLEIAVYAEKPVAIRYPKGTEDSILNEFNQPVEIGKAEVLKDGTDLAIFAIGKMSATALKVANILNNSVAVINVRSLKPLDEEMVLKYAKQTGNIITIEDNILTGGLGETIQSVLRKNNSNARIHCYGYPTVFVKHASISEIEDMYGLSVEKLAYDISKFMDAK
ncbi:MAG: 1-deoxy-D-xylulose-5-phosphate synthase [Clostridia bacterium]|nr:1-deoxy-D-xylulose-5-phosphate synthase [Clostridia bacterium]